MYNLYTLNIQNSQIKFSSCFKPNCINNQEDCQKKGAAWQGYRYCYVAFRNDWGLCSQAGNSSSFRYKIIIQMASSKMIATLLTLLVLSMQQSCPQLCTTNCSNGNCPSCFTSFSLNASISTTSTCACPVSTFLNATSALCLPCPITCQTCSSYSKCYTCIPGFLLSNSFACIPGALTATGWISKNVSYELAGSAPSGNSITITTNNSAVGLAQAANISSSCSMLPGYNWLGGYGLFGYSTKVVKSLFALPPHQWLNVRFQAVLIDKWVGNTLLLEASSAQSYLGGLSAPQIIWQGSFDSQQRFTDFCGNSSIPDNLAVVDAWIPHNLSSAVLRIRLNESDTTFNASSTLNQAFFAVRELLIRVGTCGKGCKTCAGPSQCIECILPYTLSSGSCVCNSNYGFATLSGCHANCLSGYYYNATANTCLNCEKLLPNCQTCSNATCLSCSLGFFYSNSSSSVQCVRYCPDSYTETRNISIINNRTVITDQCAPCPSNCRTCNQNICLFCIQGYVYYKGACLTSCLPATFLNQGSCSRCPGNCLACSSATTCTYCASGYALTSIGCSPYCYNSTVLASANRTCNFSCSSNCSNCFGPFTGQCLTCSNGLLQAGMCISTCSSGSYQSGTQCSQCPLECQTCSSSQNCLTCSTGYYYTASGSTGSCVRVCPPSSFPTNTATGLCVSCPAGCQRCKNANFCMECSDQYYNFNFTCLQSPPASFYFDRELRHFKPCQSNCLKCNQLVCSLCAPGYFLNQGVCVTDCGPYKFAVLQTRTTSASMSQDDEEDSEDSEGNDDQKWQSKSNNSSQYGFCEWRSPKCDAYDQVGFSGNCVQCSYFQPNLVLRSTSSNATSCFFNCPEFTTQSSSFICFPCPQNCRRCTKSMQCLECIYNYVINSPELITSSNLANETCILNYCPVPYFSDSVQCQKCNAGCSVCQIDGRCLACMTFYLLSYETGTCYTLNCTSPTQYNSGAGSCSSCISPCQTCISPTICTSCSPSSQIYLYEGSCVDACPTAFFLHRESRSCRKCNPKCATCLSFYNCLTCAPNYYLLSFYNEYQAQCVADCPIGFFSDTQVCQSCFPDCKSCYGPSQYQCLTCYPNFVLDDSQCVYACSNGKYADEYGHCDWCDSSCNDCTGPTAQNCKSCGLGYYIADNVCYKDLCPDATYLAHAEQRICDRCQFGCSNCSSPQFCRYCFPGYNLYRGWCYKTCPGNLISTTYRFPYLSFIQGYICQQCLTAYSNNCRICDQSSCTRCGSGYFLFRNSRQVVNGNLKEQCVTVCPTGTYVKSDEVSECIACQPNCVSCTTYQNCLKCDTNYNLINGYCSTSCPAGTYLTAYQNCSTCPTACPTCITPTSCSSCMLGYFLSYSSSGNACVSSCPAGYFADSSSGWCSKCLTTCQACIATNYCTQCLSGFTLSNGVCQATTPTCSSTVTNCLSCSGQNCLKCVQPYLLYINRASFASSCVSICPAGYYASIFTCEPCNSSCAACSTSAGNCSQCQNGLFLYGQNCVTVCPVGFYANNAIQACQACPANCLNCQQTTCYACESGYFLYQGQCYSTCPVATYASVGAGQCYKCPTNCTSCASDENCIGCLAASILYNGSCIQNCPTTTFSLSDAMGNSKCVPCASPCYACSDQSTCISCIPNYILNGTACQQACNLGYYNLIRTIPYEGEDQNYNFSNYTQCFPCDPSCIVCSTAATTCQACNAPYILYGSSCLPSCPPGTFINATNCLSCPPSCLACSNSNTCNVCANNTILYSGQCISSCPPAFYMTNQGNSTQNQYVCQPCSSGCGSCWGPSLYQCLTCSSTSYMTASGVCVSICPNGTYPNNAMQSCSSCPYGCSQCLNSMNCTACISNYTLTSTNQCKSNSICSVANCQFCSTTALNTCSQCLPSYYIYNSSCFSACPASTYAQNGQCIPCPANCVACTATGCTACNSLTNLYQGICVASCPVGTYLSAGYCQSDPCLAYNSATNGCLQCVTPYLLYSKPVAAPNGSVGITTVCVLNCPSGTIQSGSTCVSCSPNCLSCISPTICAVCTAGTFLYQASCQTSCPLGTYAVDGACQSCSLPHCSQCAVLSGAQSCVSCSATSLAFLYNGWCVLVCPTGTYPSTATQTCNRCGQSCVSCTSAQSCSICTSSYYLYLGQCIIACPTGTFPSGTGCSSCSTGCYQCSNSTSCSTCQPNYSLLVTSTSSSCITACPDGYYSQAIASTSYSNSNQFKCIACVAPCLTCSSSATSCTQCTANLFLSGTICQQVCPPGYFSTVSQTIVVNSNSYSTGICSSCTPPCLTCTGISTYCITCPSGYILDSSSNCVSNCSSATTYYLQTTRLCYNCSQQCYSCFGAGTDNCLSCRPPLQLYSGSCFSTCPYAYYPTSAYVCQKCTSPCLACTGSANNCSICASGTYIQTINGLSTCTTACPNGYYLNVVLKSCVLCNSNCLTCNNLNQCLSCPSGLYLFNQTCVSVCPAATAPATVNNQPICSPCPANCLSCASTSSNQVLSCTQCSARYYLVSGVCTQTCPTGTYATPTSYSCVNCGITGCQNCLLSSSLIVSCTACQSGYFSYSGACVTACPNGTVTSGSQCSTPPACTKYQWNGYCLTSCPTGTFPTTIALSNNSSQTSLTCLNCSAFCTSCISISSCSSCASSTYLYWANPSQSTCVSTCPSGSYLLNTTCRACSAPCLTCQLTSSAVVCVTCQVGFVQYGSSCLSACPLGYYAISSQCLACSAVCASCVGSASTCLTCKNVNAVAPACVTSVNCTGSTYQSSNISCSNCDPACLTCYGSASYECLSCTNSTNILVSGSCTASCPPTTVRNFTVCVTCPSNCLVCTVSGPSLSCSSCASPYILFSNSNGGICIQSCSSLNNGTQSYVLVNGQCQLCNIPACLLCSYANAQFQCSSCLNSTYLYNQKCVTACPSGTMPSSNTCVSCPQNCLTCTTSGCNACSSGYYLQGVNCVSNCGSGFYSLNATCRQCTISNCLNCTATACLSCQQPSLLDASGQCNSCVSGYFMLSGSCQICSSQCLTCSGSSSACTKCSTGYMVFNSSCVVSCPTGYYATSTGSCSACTVANCQTCTANSCSSCLTGYVLFNQGSQSCQNSCSASMYLSSSTNSCINCSSSCTTCSSSTSCSVCASPSVLYLGYCFSACPSGYYKSGQTCVICPSGCKTCNSASSCSTCSAGMTINSNGTCSVPPNTCQNGYYLTTLNGCSQCYPTCNTCSAGNSNNCLTCYSGYTFSNGVCVQNCNSNSFFNSNSTCQLCSSAFANCVSCTASNCLSCATNYTVLNGNCTLSCPSGTFSSNSICLSCPAFCLSCIGSSNCSQCLTSAFLVSGICYTSCPAQTYLLNNACASCYQTCITCQGSSTNCSSCITPYSLYASSCLASCPNGTYSSNYTCQSCAINCLLCTGTNACTQCSSSYYLISGTCRTTCPSGYYIDSASNRCLQCVTPCLVCTSRTACSSCSSPATLINGFCVNANCPGGYYDTSLSACENCTVNHCGYCNSTTCSSCVDGYYSIYMGGSFTYCEPACIAGTYADNVTMNCSSCFTNCFTCVNTSWCNLCNSGYYVLSVAGALANECVTICPLGYYLNSSIYHCVICDTNCASCTNKNACLNCNSNYYLLAVNNTTSCVNNCPTLYYTPTPIDGSGQCGLCAYRCYACIDAATCTQCNSASDVIVSGTCTPSNCVHCLSCDYSGNKCAVCSTGYFLFNNACKASCPDGYYGDNSTAQCLSCGSNCLLCRQPNNCLLCISGYMFVNGSGCQNAGLVKFGILGNMSGFTSNITKIMAIVYVSTSSGPIAFGAVGNTYNPMQSCQFLYLLQGSTGGNQEVNNFLNSLSAVSYTTNSGTNNNSNNSTGGSSQRRMLTAINYTSNFLQTNLPIFLIMISFVSAYVVVLLLQKYNNSCCMSCPTLLKYINYICDFMQKRFKYIYVDTVMWISYLPFLYFAILQLTYGKFDSGINIFSSLLAIAIIIVYPLYPIFILRKIFDRSDNPAEDLRNYKAITLKEPPRVDEEKTMCADVTCCAQEDPSVSMVEMSLSPFIDKVVRPIYNEFDPDYSEFRYFKIEHWRLAYAPIKYVRKFIFVLIVALCPDPITTLSLLVVITSAYMTYLIVLRPKEKLYLVLEIILESVLLFFIVFMMVYLTQGGASVSALSIMTHAFGFLIANSTLAIAIILNLMSYYTIFCCIVDLISHLRSRAIEDDLKEKAFEEIVDDKEKIEYKDKDKEEIDIRKSLKRGDDQMTVENNEDENYIPYDLDEKEFNVRSSMIKKKKTFEDEEPEEDFTNLRSTKNPKTKSRRERKKSTPKIEIEEGHTSEEMGHSKMSEENDIVDGLLKDKNSKFKRQVNKNDVNIDKGEVRQPTDKFRKSRHPKITAPQEQESMDVLRPDVRKEPLDEFVADIDTHDRIVPNKKSDFAIDPTFAERQAKRRDKNNDLDPNIQEPYMRERGGNTKSSQPNELSEPYMKERGGNKKSSQPDELSEATLYDRQGRPKNAQNEKDLERGNMVERERRRKERENPFEAEDPSDLTNANTYDRQGKRKNAPEESGKDIEGANAYERSKNKDNLADANMYERKGDNKRAQNEKDLENANMIERERERKKKQNPFGEFEQIFAKEDNKGIKDAQMEERARKEKQNSLSSEKLVSGFLVDEGNTFERKNQPKKHQNLHYKGSDEEEVKEGQVVEAKNKFRKNARNVEKSVPEADINAHGKDIKTKKVEKMQSTKQFVEDTLEEGKYKERQGKQIQKLKSMNEKAEADVEEASGYNREKRVAERKKQESQPKVESGNTLSPSPVKPSRNKPNIYDDLTGDITESVEFREEKKLQQRKRASNDNEDFEQSNMAKIIKTKPEKQKRAQDNRMQLSENLEESYEDLVRKNKEQMFKQTVGNKSNLLDLGGEDEFEEVSYSRPESKIERPKSRSKDMGLGVNSRAGSEASDNESRDIRKQRASAIQRHRKKGTLNVNDNESNDDDNEVGADSRRISRIKKQKSKMVKGVLNIEDKSENEDIQDVQL